MRDWASKFSRTSGQFAAAAVLCAASVLVAQVRSLTTPPTISKPEDLCSIQGRITNAITGEPLTKATVVFQLLRLNTPQAVQGYSTSSDNDGNYRIENVESGDYWVSAIHDGYQIGRYGSVRGDIGVPALTLRPGQQLTNIDLKLLPYAAVSGKVVDQEGDPVEGATVELLRQNWRAGKSRYLISNSSNTNDLGSYRIANVSPGKYYLFAHQVSETRHGEYETTDTGNSDLRPLKTYFPDAPTREAATPLSVKGGQDLADIDVKMLSGPTFHIRGKLAGVLPDDENRGLVVQVGLVGDEAPGFRIAQANVAPDRTFDIAGITPGSYRLTLSSRTGQLHPFGHTDVDLGKSDLNNVQIAVTPAVTLHGQITVEGSPLAGAAPVKFKSIRVGLAAPDPNSELIYGTFESRSVNDDATFTIENVPPGKFNVYVNNRPRATYLKSIRIANQEVTGHVVNVPPGGGELVLTLSYGVAELHGSIQFPQGTSSEGATNQAVVYLLPEPMDEYGNDIRMAPVQNGGNFSMISLPPGRYRALAADGLTSEDVQNADILAQVSGEITDIILNPGEKKQIQLPLISRDEIQQVYVRLGIEPSF
jgi:hypothetical protein